MKIMSRFQWTRSREVFVEELDAQHRSLYQAADALHCAIPSGTDTPRIVELLRALMAAAEEHFAHEERLMRSSRYPAYEWHKQQHDTVRKRLSQFVPRIESGENDAATLLLEFLSGWLKDHTGVTDRLLGAHLRSYYRVRAAS